MENSHCPATSICTDFTCICPSGTIKHGNECIQEVKSKQGNRENKKITSAEEVELEEVSIKQTKVIGKNSKGGIKKAKPAKEINLCKPNEILYNEKCIPKSVALGKQCETSIQCKKGAKCVRQKCRCLEGTAGFKNACISAYYNSTRN